MGDSTTHPILSMLLRHTTSGPSVVLVFYRPSARSYWTDISHLAEILPKVGSGVAHCVKLLKNLSRFAEYIFRK